jgi:hypothetical protein
VANDDDTELMLAAQRLVPAQRLSTSVEALSVPLAGFLDNAGLPVDDVLVPFEERRTVLNSFSDAISILPASRRASAYYLSKYVVAISMGLFDAALNYLWNETTEALRQLVARTDLEYFFDIVEKRSGIRRKLQTAEDLPEIGEAMLVEGCHRIGLLSSVNHERLKHINFMRNHASAAHPNQSELNGAEMVGWLTNCLRYAITAEPSPEVITVNRLLGRVRSNPIDAGDAPVIVDGLLRLPRARIDDLLWTLFGIYCDTTQIPQTRANIDLLAKDVWQAATESRRYEIGVRLGEFVKHAEADKKAFAHRFLTVVDGLAYRSEEILVVELLDKLRTLHSVHIGTNNFYNERNHALSLGQSLPANGQVPAAIRREWVKVITICCIGNGHGYKDGVDEVAAPYYVEHIKNFGEPEIVEFLGLFSDSDFTSDLQQPKADKRARQVAAYLKGRTRHVHLLSALDQVSNAPAGTLPHLHKVTAFVTALANAPS